MARSGTTILDTNDPFPEIEFQLLNGESFNVMNGKGEGYTVLFFYRGYWWPGCSRQLADFQSLLKEYQAEDIRVIAGSTDPFEMTKEFNDKLGITYDMAYGIDAEAFSRVTGAFYNKEKKFLEATGFIIRPDKRIQAASYS